MVDYCVISHELSDNIANFSVGQLVPWLSDHCSINTTIKFSQCPAKREITQLKPIDLHPGWLWNEIARENFEKNLTLPYYKEKFEALEKASNLTPVEIAKEIRTLLIENTKTSGIQEK